jgi:hypothetical protein
MESVEEIKKNKHQKSKESMTPSKVKVKHPMNEVVNVIDRQND